MGVTSSLGQVLRFLFLVVSFDFRYQLTLNDNPVNVLGVFVQVVASVLVMYYSIETPYSALDDDSSNTNTIITFCLLQLSTSTVLEDTDILFTTGSLVSWSSLGPQNNNNFNAVSAVPAEFVRVVNYSKMISFFGAVLYMIPLMVYNNPPRRSAVRDVLHTGLGRVSILLVLVFNIYTYLVVGVSGNLLSKRDHSPTWRRFRVSKA